MASLPAPLSQLHDLELLLTARHPIIFIETIEEERADALLEHVADHLDLLYLSWTRTAGLEHRFVPSAITGTHAIERCLEHVIKSQNEALYYLKGFTEELESADVRALLRKLHDVLWQHRGAIVFSGPGTVDLPVEISRLVTSVVLAPPTDVEYHQFLAAMLRDMRSRAPVRMELKSEDVGQLIRQLRGLSFFEVKKIMTQAIAERWTLDMKIIERVLEAKKEVIRRSGVLEYTPAEYTMSDIAGLEQLKGWLRKRRAVFREPHKAREFGLTPPKGILLLGVPGCGKSLSARAVAAEYQLPLIRLDPARLYTKYVGETEKNLRHAIKTAESMAPIVLWIDEIEKAFSSDSNDSGVSQRVFGTFLSWMQDKAEGVFVIATCNDVSELPPELLRKGRFDEIFFVDLPKATARERILALHLSRRKRDPAEYDLPALAEHSQGFSGSELEQAIVSALYLAYSTQEELTTEHIAHELQSTQPLSKTMGERIDKLRSWAEGRAVPAN